MAPEDVMLTSHETIPLSLSGRAGRILPQPMFHIMAEAQRLERQGRRVLHLEIGDTTGFRNDDLIACLQEATAAPALGYAPALGLHELRSAIAENYSREKRTVVTADMVAVSSANALISQTLAVLTDPGDTVLVPDPGFPTYGLSARYLELNVRHYRLRQDAGWNPSLSEIVRMMDDQPKVRAIIINSPSNPLGTVMDPHIIEGIAEYAAERGIACIIDETYKDLVYDTASRPARHRANNIYLYSFSKDAAAPGLRMGCVVGPRAVIEKIGDYSSMFFSCSPPLFQKTILSYIQRQSPYAATIRHEMTERIAAVDAILSAAPALSYVLPKAAFYVYVNISSLGADADEFAHTLLNEAGVCVCPGTAFGPAGRTYVRLSLAGKREDVEEGCRKLAEFALLYWRR